MQSCQLTPQTATRVFSSAELAMFDGVYDRRIYVALKGYVYDVSERRDLYGFDVGGAYAKLAGHDATRALTKMSLSVEDVGRCDIGDLLESNLAELHEKALHDWVQRFERHYAVVGTLEPPWDSAASAALPTLAAPALPTASFMRRLCTLGAAVAKIVAAPVVAIQTMHPSPLRPVPTPELICAKPRLYQVRAFLTLAECSTLRKMATGATGMIFNAEKVREGLRVTDTRWTSAERELLVAVETRLGWLLGSEPHEDEVELVGTLTPPGTPSTTRCHLGLHVDTNGGRPWRYATAVIYLSSVPDGGHTVFPVARTVEDEADGPPSDEDLETLEAAQRLLDAGIDHTDHVLVNGQDSERRVDAEALIAAAEARCGASMRAEEGSVALFWTRRCDGSIDPYSWHGGEGVGGAAAKWTLQKFKEVPAAARVGDKALADFVAGTRRRVAN